MLRRTLVASLAATSAESAYGQDDRPIRLIFPFAPGSAGDALARLAADEIRPNFGRPVLVENRTGAAGRIGVQAVKSAPADGSTLLWTPIAPVVIYPLVYQSLGYDPFIDLRPVTQVATFDFGLAVGSHVPAASMTELIAWLKANPSQQNYATPGAGTLPHFFGVMWARAAGLELVHAPARGTAGSLQDVVAGHLPMLLTSTNELTQPHRTGRIKVLATSGRDRSPHLPDVPTFREQGFALEGTGWFGVFAPAQTPDAAIDELNRALVGAIRGQRMTEMMAKIGLVPAGTSPAELARIQLADRDAWAPAVRASGFTPEQ